MGFLLLIAIIFFLLLHSGFFFPIKLIQSPGFAIVTAAMVPASTVYGFGTCVWLAFFFSVFDAFVK